MTTHSTGKWLALVAGSIATACALALLLQDAIRTGHWTIEHALIPGLMAVQIATGHLFTVALHQRRWLAAGGFLIVAGVATWCVLDTSVAKQGAVQAEATAKAEDVNGRRKALERSIADAEAMLMPCPEGSPKKHFGTRCSLREAMTAECATGKGTACTGKTASVTLYEAALKTHREELAGIGPAQAVGAKTENMATLLATISGRDKGRIRQVLEIGRPFQFALAFELAALACFGFAFGHGRKAGGNATEHQAAKDPEIEKSASISGNRHEQADLHSAIDQETIAVLAGEEGPENEPPKPRGPRKSNGKSNVIAFPARHPVMQALDKAGGTVASNRELAQLMGVSEGQSTKLVAEVAHLLTFRRVGKCLEISLKAVRVA